MRSSLSCRKSGERQGGGWSTGTAVGMEGSRTPAQLRGIIHIIVDVGGALWGKIEMVLPGGPREKWSEQEMV